MEEEVLLEKGFARDCGMPECEQSFSLSFLLNSEVFSCCLVCDCETFS